MEFFTLQHSIKLGLEFQNTGHFFLKTALKLKPQTCNVEDNMCNAVIMPNWYCIIFLVNEVICMYFNKKDPYLLISSYSIDISFMNSWKIIFNNLD